MRKRSFLSVLWPLSLFGLAACGGNNSPDQAALIDQSTGKVTVLVATCSGCHSDTSGGIASLGGYSPAALEQSLLSYKSDADGSTVMHRLARGYSEADIELISNYLGEEAAEQ